MSTITIYLSAYLYICLPTYIPFYHTYHTYHDYHTYHIPTGFLLGFMRVEPNPTRRP